MFGHQLSTSTVTLEQSSDEQLLALISKRDRRALATLYDRHSQVVYNLLMRIVRDPHAAEDLLQDSFWQVWKSAGSYANSGAAAAWIYRIARNKALDQLRRTKARPPIAAEVTALPVDASARPTLPSVEETVERRWRAEQVRKGLAAIPEEQRMCLELAYFEGMSQSQIAETLSLPLGTVKTRLRLGVEKLERILVGAGVERSAFP